MVKPTYFRDSTYRVYNYKYKSLYLTSYLGGPIANASSYISLKSVKSAKNPKEHVTLIFDNARANGSSQYLTLEISGTVKRDTIYTGAPVVFQVDNGLTAGWDIYKQCGAYRIYDPHYPPPGRTLRPKISSNSTSKRSDDIDPSDILGLEVGTPDDNDESEYWNIIQA